MTSVGDCEGEKMVVGEGGREAVEGQKVGDGCRNGYKAIAVQQPDPTDELAIKMVEENECDGGVRKGGLAGCRHGTRSRGRVRGRLVGGVERC
jgi:hypothetical protein